MLTVMKKSFKLENLECANCARKMEDAIKKLGGVEDVNISFITQKMTLTADDDKFDDVLKSAAKICKKIEPDCKILI